MSCFRKINHAIIVSGSRISQSSQYRGLHEIVARSTFIKTQRIGSHFSLRDNGFLRFKNELNRIFNGNNMFHTSFINMFNHRLHRGRFSTSVGPVTRTSPCFCVISSSTPAGSPNSSISKCLTRNKRTPWKDFSVYRRCSHENLFRLYVRMPYRVLLFIKRFFLFFTRNKRKKSFPPCHRE